MSPVKPLELSREDKLTLRTGKAAKDFLESEFGRFVQSVFESHIATKRNEFEAPAEVGIDGISQILRAEANKGAIIGLRLALSIIPGMVVAADEVRKRNGISTSTAGEDE